MPYDAERSHFTRLRYSRPVRLLGSLKLGLGCLLLLFLLVLAGTLYQTEYGLYAAQQKFFHAWVTTVGPVPIPGAQAVLTLLAVNLLVSTVFTIRFRLENLGLLLIHLGLIVLVAGAFQAHIYAEESVVALREGEARSAAYDTRVYELVVHGEEAGYAVSEREISEGTTIRIPDSSIRITVERIYQNARPLFADDGSRRVTALVSLPRASEQSANRRGMELRITEGGSGEITLYLLGAANAAARIRGEAGSFGLSLRPTRHELPFELYLDNFEPEFYPRSDIPRAFTSTVIVSDAELSREAVITMNQPLRHAGYTVYQSSYAPADDGSYVSVFAVVQNPVQVLPYVVSLLISIGLVLHFVVRYRAGREPSGKAARHKTHGARHGS